MNPSKQKGREQLKKPEPKPQQEALQPEAQAPEMAFASLAEVQRAAGNPEEASRKGIRGVQRAYGNQFVQNLAQRRHGRRPIQAKLNVNEPDDQFEKEAEAMAEALPTAENAPPPPPSSNGNGVGNGNGNNGGDSNDGHGDNLAVATKPQSNGAVNGQAGPDGHAAPKVEPIQLKTTPAPTVLPTPTPTPTAVDTIQEKEAELSSDLESVIDSLPPIGNGDSGDSGDDNNSQATLAPTTTQRKSDPESDTTPKPITRGIPTQLTGQLFQKAIQPISQPTNQPTNQPANPTHDSPIEREELPTEELAQLAPEHVPPVGNPDEGDSDENMDALSLSQAIQRDEMGTGFGGEDRAVHEEVETSIERRRGGGEKLDDGVRGQMESHFQSDFSGVRVHTDDTADTLNRSLNAQAFTTGQDIFFGQGKYEPGSQGGQKLIAHELTHVVQQGGAQRKPQAKAQTKRQSAPAPATTIETSPPPEISRNRAQQVQLMRSTAVALTLIQRLPGPAQNGTADLITRTSHTQLIQLKSREEKAKEKAKAKAEAGKDKASDKSSEAESKTNNPGEANSKEVKGKGQPLVPKIPPTGGHKMDNPAAQVDPDSVENAPAEMDTGGLGWYDVQADMLPDWDSEISKYDSFQAGDFDALGLDTSGLEADTTGITVDDQSTRQAMVADALNGLSTPTAEEHAAHLGGMLDLIPYAGVEFPADEIFTEGPKQWFNNVKEGFSNDFSDVGKGFSDLFGGGTGSGWARMAALMKALIAILQIVRKIVNIIRMVTDIFYWILIIFKKLSELPFIGFLFRWARPLVERVLMFFSPLGMMVMQIDMVIKTFRFLAALFLSIDMIYYETDPEKLMERQAELAGHVQGLRSSTQQNIKKGISQKYKDEREAEDGMIGAEDMEDPQISPFSIEDVSQEEQGTKDDYKKKWLSRYGVPSVADEVSSSLLEKRESLPPPPLMEYGAEREQDVRYRLDRNAIAIMMLEREKLGIKTHQAEAEQAQQVAENQAQIFDTAVQNTQQNIDAIEPHKQDMAHRLDKQDEMRGKTAQTADGAQQGQEQSGVMQVALKAILGFISFFAGGMKRAGTKNPQNSEEDMSDGADKSMRGNKESEDASKKGTAEADERTADTKRTQDEAAKSESELGDLKDELGGYKEESLEGAENIAAEKERMDESISTIDTLEEELIEERTEAINEAVGWMGEWRTMRAEIFEEVEQNLEKRFEENADSEEEEDSAGYKADVFDEFEDRKTKGSYFGEEFEEKEEAFDF